MSWTAEDLRTWLEKHQVKLPSLLDATGDEVLSLWKELCVDLKAELVQNGVSPAKATLTLRRLREDLRSPSPSKKEQDRALMTCAAPNRTHRALPDKFACVPRRLAPVLSAEARSSPPTDKISCTYHTAWVLLQVKCTLFGGFVRDLVGDCMEENVDIDAELPSIHTIDSMLQVLSLVQDKYFFTLAEKQPPRRRASYGGVVQTVAVEYANCGVTVMVDLVALKIRPRRVDASVNSLALLPGGFLHLRVSMDLALHEVIEQILNRTFHFNPRYQICGQVGHYNLSRALKLLKKGYTCLSGVPVEQVPEWEHLIQ